MIGKKQFALFMALALALPAIVLTMHLVQSSIPEADDPPPWQKVYEDNEVSGPCRPSTDREKMRWQNKSFTEISSELGNPESDEEFFLDQDILVGERYLLRDYAERAGDDVSSFKVRESIWLNGDCKLIVWYKNKDTGWEFLNRLYFEKHTIIY